jgi:hypothetical protein
MYVVHGVLCSSEFKRHALDVLYGDGTGEITHDLRTKRLQTRQELIAIRSLQNTQAVTHGSLSSCLCSLDAHTALQYSAQEFALTRFHIFL